MRKWPIGFRRRTGAGYLALALTAGFSTAAFADQCLDFDISAKSRVESLVRPGMMLVEYQEGEAPIPVHVRSVRFLEEPARDAVYLNSRRFSVEDLRLARDEKRGPLYEYAKQFVDEQYAEFQIGALLRDLSAAASRKDVTLVVNDEERDVAYLYVPQGGDQYRNLGLLANCGAGQVKPTISFTPPKRDPQTERPPALWDAAPAARCGEGSCFAGTARTIQPVILRAAPADTSRLAAKVPRGAELQLKSVKLTVVPARATAVFDHRQISQGDVFYVLDSEGEGYYSVWHYGSVFDVDLGGVDVYSSARHPTCANPSRDCWARVEQPPRETWWVEVATADGLQGWLRDPDRNLDAFRAAE